MKIRNNKQKVLNTFEGDNAVLDFLNPDNTPFTPLVEIPGHLNPYKKNGVRIFAKLMNMLPLANVKSLPAYNMLLEKKEKGELDGVDTVIENSSGNTVLSLAVIARLMGISHTKAVVSNEVTKGKLGLLRLLGTEIIVNEEPICPDPSDINSGIYKAKVWSKENGWFNPGQYDNLANPGAHQKWTAPQIWEQTRGKISILSVGLGTTGTVVGLGSYLKSKNPDLKIVGVSRIPNNPVPGVRTKNLLKEVAFDWKSNLDYQEEVGTVESFKMSMELCRNGIMAGPSSGFALAGLLNYLSRQEFKDSKEKVAVFICPDSPLPYIDEYFEYLKDDEFPKIENEHLLTEKVSDVVLQDPLVKELSPEQVFNLVFKDTVDNNWEKIRHGEKIEIKKGFAIIDVRKEGEYEDHHIPESINVPFNDLDDYLKENKNILTKNEAVIFVCRHGNTSKLAASKAEQSGISSISLSGGNAEWSRINLPRVRAGKCIVRFDLS